MNKDNLIVSMTFDFALQIIELYKKMTDQKEFVLSKQLLRSGTSIGANVEEAVAGQTKKDFIAKMAIASKEARETRYWLRLLEKSKLVQVEYENHLNAIENIINVLTKIVKTAQSTI
ncbi:four helix bundle protein [Flavisolibacter nicotianae]|uniref:four helix bundle protein n=1 Tax=Flavisolibacter nicotianae TaxID=2364882 RepID=UPI000EAC471E|nr:four helix bundle protein [Flavisolibacter nicotianae]